MKVQEAYDLINKLRAVKSQLQHMVDKNKIYGDMELIRKVRQYNTEIDRITECIMNQELEDSFTFNYDLYFIKGEDDE